MNKVLKTILGIILSPMVWMAVIYFVFQFNRYPEIWTTNRIILFFVIAIPLSIIFYFIEQQYQRFKRAGNKK